ncbi:MAG: DEAD/DEAH box helicase [Coleofasciculaceae cyanobacterium]
MKKNKPTDYTALIRAVKAKTSSIPDWLTLGRKIYAPKYGTGEVISLLGKRLIMKFPGVSQPVQFQDWQKAIQEGEICASNSAATGGNFLVQSGVSEGQIAAIPQPKFREIARELRENLTAVEIMPAKAGELSAFPQNLPVSLKKALKKVGINHLYSHQLESVLQLREGKDVSIVTPAASGKTLCYNVAILEHLLFCPDRCALYIFPLKALANDQLRKLEYLVAALPASERLRVAQLTGDTPYNQRQQLFVPYPPHILAVSPDLLHYQLEKVRRLPEWEPWREFLWRLRCVVIDEAHTYIGAFGAHFANLMRRLRRAVDSVGGNSNKIQFICSSATIGNPVEMAQRFSGRTQQPERLHLVETSGAESAEQTILSLTPSNAANRDACKIILSWLRHDLKGIVFCNSRAAVKNLIGLVQREAQRQGIGYLANSVAAFYGSLKGDRRRRIIGQLESGSLKVILSTSALEAGIDLPELDCCLIRGYPGSIMSFRQRIGRAGRKNPGLIIFLPVAQNPLDYYYGNNPQQLLRGEVESAAFNPDYPTILSKHLECCCVESGLPILEVEHRFGSKGGTIASELLEQGKLRLSSSYTLWTSGYPHRGVNIRSNIQDSIELIDNKTGESFEEMSREIAYREVFTGALYTAFNNEGETITYWCSELDLELRQAYLEPLDKDPGLFTEAETQLDIQLIEPLEEAKIISTTIPEGTLRLSLHWGEITSLVRGYKMLSREYQLTCKNPSCKNNRRPLKGKTCSACSRPLGYAELTKVTQEVFFPQPYATQYQAPVVKVEMSQEVAQIITNEVNPLKSSIRSKYGNEIPEEYLGLLMGKPEFVALHSMGHQIIFAVPLVVLSSRHDVNFFALKEGEITTGYFFDTCEGGNGAVEAIFQQLPKLAAKAKSLAKNCDCEHGCPRCLIQHGCPQQNFGLFKEIGLLLLDAISGLEEGIGSRE